MPITSANTTVIPAAPAVVTALRALKIEVTPVFKSTGVTAKGVLTLIPYTANTDGTNPVPVAGATPVVDTHADIFQDAAGTPAVPGTPAVAAVPPNLTTKPPTPGKHPIPAVPAIPAIPPDTALAAFITAVETAAQIYITAKGL